MIEDFLAKVVGEILFRLALWLIGKIGSTAFAQEVQHALLERVHRLGIWAGLSAAVASMPSAVNSRLRSIARAWFGREVLAENVGEHVPITLFTTVIMYALSIVPVFIVLAREYVAHEHNGWLEGVVILVTFLWIFNEANFPLRFVYFIGGLLMIGEVGAYFALSHGIIDNARGLATAYVFLCSRTAAMSLVGLPFLLFAAFMRSVSISVAESGYATKVTVGIVCAGIAALQIARFIGWTLQGPPRSEVLMAVLNGCIVPVCLSIAFAILLQWFADRRELRRERVRPFAYPFNAITFNSELFDVDVKGRRDRMEAVIARKKSVRL